MSVSACTAAGCQAVMVSLPVRLSARRAVISGLGLLPPNATLNASLTVVNRAGAAATFTASTALVVDVDAPTGLAPTLGFAGGAKTPTGWPSSRAMQAGGSYRFYWPSRVLVAGAWSAVDATGVAEYRWAVCRAELPDALSTSARDCPLPWTSAGGSTFAKAALSGPSQLAPAVVWRE